MAVIGEDGKVRFGPWPGGINNVDSERDLAPADLVNSINHSFDIDGTPKTRPGRTKLVAGQNCNSMFAHGDDVYYFDDGTLYHLNIATSTKTQLATGYGTKRFSIAKIGHKAFFSNGEDAGRLNLSTKEVQPGLGTTTPALNVTLQANAVGNLPAGRYFVAVVYEDQYGEESGCTAPSFINLQNDGSIEVILDGPRPTDAADIRIYVSETNGSRAELYSYGLYPADTLSITVSNLETGQQITTLYKETMPPCKYLTAYNGRLYGAIDSYVVCSEIQRYGVYDPDFGHLWDFSEAVTVLEHFNGGVFVVADRTYAYVGANPDSMVLRDDVFNHRAIAGTGMQVPAKTLAIEGIPNASGDVPFWFSRRGAVIGLSDGSVYAPSHKKALPERFNYGMSGVVEYNGRSELVCALREKTGPEDNYSMSDNFSVRVISNGIPDPVE